jgi:2-polyprenyl-6-methoxyphenol hydroxylase-like FAD-dependent oxidoreductase
VRRARARPGGVARHDHEPAAGEPPGDAGLGLDRALLSQVTGVDATAVPVITGNRDSAAWGLVRQFLIDVVQRTAGIRLTESVTVTGVRKPDGPDQVLDSTAGPFTADVVVGADGVYSVTRRFLVPERPAASYAGYMLWRGLVSEAEVPAGVGRHGSNLEIHAAPGAQLVIYCVPGADGRTDRGHRRVSYAWYDGSRTDMLRETGCIQGDVVVATLRADQARSPPASPTRRACPRALPATSGSGSRRRGSWCRQACRGAAPTCRRGDSPGIAATAEAGIRADPKPP